MFNTPKVAFVRFWIGDEYLPEYFMPIVKHGESNIGRIKKQNKEQITNSLTNCSNTNLEKVKLQQDNTPWHKPVSPINGLMIMKLS